MSSAKPALAFFGATGGCTGATLAHALNNGHHCTACESTSALCAAKKIVTDLPGVKVARTPDKLRTFLAEQHNVDTALTESNLTIVQGDAKDPVAVAQALVSPINSALLVDTIVSGLGGYPTFHWSIMQPFPLADPTICENAMRTIFTAIENLLASPQGSVRQKPRIVIITTAAASKKRGVPLSIYLPYLYLLSSPLKDKIRLEEAVFDDRGQHVRDFVVIRPPFLLDVAERGLKAIKVGWVWGVESGQNREKELGQHIGWYIGKKDLGRWVFEKVIREGGWEGRCVNLTY
jgi:hypothetical protein